MNDPIFEDPTVHQRAIDSILAGEHELRRIAEGTSHSLSEILMNVAYRWDGRRLEDMRQKDPHAPGNWSPAEWKEFFQSFHPEQQGWLTPKVALDDLCEKLSDENYELRKKIAEQKLLIEELSQKLLEKKESDKAAQTDLPVQSPKIMVPPDYEDIIEPLRNLKLPQRSLRYKDMFAETESLYRRQMMLLYLIATRGVSIRIEMDLVMAAVEGISPRSSVVRKIVEKLVKGGLLESKVLTLEKPLHTSIQLVWLSMMGKNIGKELGWQIVESEWEKLKKCIGDKESEEKAVAIMMTALHARVREFRVKLFPRDDPAIASDLLLTDSENNEYHTFMLMGSSISPEKLEKMERRSGTVGICGMDKEQGSVLTELAKSAGIKHGVSTDLVSLITGGRENQQPIPLAEIDKSTLMWEGAW